MQLNIVNKHKNSFKLFKLNNNKKYEKHPKQINTQNTLEAKLLKQVWSYFNSKYKNGSMLCL